MNMLTVTGQQWLAVGSDWQRQTHVVKVPGLNPTSPDLRRLSPSTLLTTRLNLGRLNVKSQ